MFTLWVLRTRTEDYYLIERFGVNAAIISGVSAASSRSCLVGDPPEVILNFSFWLRFYFFR
jgi:hypothetical protein